MKQTKIEFTNEQSQALYRIFCGLSASCYTHAQVHDSAKKPMEEVFDLIIKWGRENVEDITGGIETTEALNSKEIADMGYELLKGLSFGKALK